MNADGHIKGMIIMARNGGRKIGRLADMSFPAKVRIVKRKGKKIGGTPSAQMSHGNSSRKKKGKKQ